MLGWTDGWQELVDLGLLLCRALGSCTSQLQSVRGAALSMSGEDLCHATVSWQKDKCNYISQRLMTDRLNKLLNSISISHVSLELFCTCSRSIFTWNEVLEPKKKNIGLPLTKASNNNFGGFANQVKPYKCVVLSQTVSFENHCN